MNAALSPSGEELAWALDVLETLERCGVRDGSDLPRIARAQGLLAAAVGVRHRHGCRRVARLRLRGLIVGRGVLHNRATPAFVTVCNP